MTNNKFTSLKYLVENVDFKFKSKNKYPIYTAGTLSPRIEEGVGGGALLH